MKNKIPIFGIITLLLIVFRCIFDINEQLVFINALINVASLFIVVCAIVEQAKYRILNKINSSDAFGYIKKREIKRITQKINCITYISLAILGIIYLLFFSCELGNDIISIAALGISLSSDFIVDVLLEIIRLER